MSVPEGSVTVLAPVPPPAQHPTACPSWCKHWRSPMRHDFGPSFTPHLGTELVLANPSPNSNEKALLRAELFRLDEGSETGKTVLYINGESEVDLSRDELEALIPQVQAFLTGLQVAHRQMDA